MTLPFQYPFKTRVLSATSTSTASTTLMVTVPNRGKLDSAYLTVGFNSSQSAAATVDFVLSACGLTTTAAIIATTIMGSTSIGTGAVTTTTGGSFNFSPTTATVYVNPGDVLGFYSTGTAGAVVSWVIKEF